MAEYPIIMKQKNDQGDYDTLYPKTLGSQVEGMTLDQVSGNLASNRIEGSIPSSQITGQFPASQITGLPTSLPANGGNADTVGNQTVSQIVQAAVNQGVRIKIGNYIGTYGYGRDNPNSLVFEFEPKFILIFPNEKEGNTLGPSGFVLMVNNIPVPAIPGNTSNSIGAGWEITWAGNSVSWYSFENSYCQCNEQGTSYVYFAIG